MEFTAWILSAGTLKNPLSRVFQLWLRNWVSVSMKINGYSPQQNVSISIFSTFSNMLLFIPKPQHDTAQNLDHYQEVFGYNISTLHCSFLGLFWLLFWIFSTAHAQRLERQVATVLQLRLAKARLSTWLWAFYRFCWMPRISISSLFLSLRSEIPRSLSHPL